MIIRHPESALDQEFRVMTEVERLTESVRRPGDRIDRREVEDREGNHCLFVFCLRRFRAMGALWQSLNFSADAAPMSTFIEGGLSRLRAGQDAVRKC